MVSGCSAGWRWQCSLFPITLRRWQGGALRTLLGRALFSRLGWFFIVRGRAQPAVRPGGLFFQGSAGLSSFSSFLLVRLVVPGRQGGQPAAQRPLALISRFGWFSRAPQSVRKAPPCPRRKEPESAHPQPPPATSHPCAFRAAAQRLSALPPTAAKRLSELPPNGFPRCCQRPPNGFPRCRCPPPNGFPRCLRHS